MALEVHRLRLPVVRVALEVHRLRLPVVRRVRLRLLPIRLEIRLCLVAYRPCLVASPALAASVVRGLQRG